MYSTQHYIQPIIIIYRSQIRTADTTHGSMVLRKVEKFVSIKEKSIN